MTMKWSFTFNSFVKFPGKILEPQYDHVTDVVYPNMCYNEVFYKVTAL